MRRRVLRAPLGRWVDPAAAFAALHARDTDVVWLDSGPHATTGASYIAAGRAVTEFGGSVFDWVRSELLAHAVTPTGDGFALGLVGWLGYELRFATLGQERTRQSRYPDAAFLVVERAIEFDHATREVTLLALGQDWAEVAEWRDATIAALDAAAQAPAPGGPLTPGTPPAPARTVPDSLAAPATVAPPSASTRAEVAPTTPAAWAYSDSEYLSMIEACQAAITEGEAYQLCLTTEARLEVTPEPLETYLALRAASPSHHGALLRIGEIALLSSSPEQFITVTPAGVVESSPIKGTRRRGATPLDDERLRRELESSDKERAENLMIVDLMRNDIGRVSEVGSVEVTSLMAVESYAQVHQLVSTVRGRLRPDLDAVAAVESCFPAGSMTGAPKHSATLILDGLERRARGIYSGAFGYFGFDGRVDLAMVIRSIVIDPAGATVGSGGGITALSVPAEELEEVRVKAAALLRVLVATDASG